MSDFCYGCGRYLDDNELQCPECGRLTEKGIQNGYVASNDQMRQRGILYLIMGIILLGTAICLMMVK